MFVCFDSRELVMPRELLVQFIQKLTEGVAPTFTVDRRTEPRWTIVMPVAVMPVDIRLRPNGEQFVAITRDISSRGLALYHTAEVPAKSLLAVELRNPQGDTLQAVLEVLRCRADGPAFEIGGQFVVKSMRPTNN